jgi:hypothetical protein
METLRRSMIVIAALTALTLMAGCEKGPMQKAGERVDRALDQEPLVGKGPMERTGKDIDKTVDDLKK